MRIEEKMRSSESKKVKEGSYRKCFEQQMNSKFNIASLQSDDTDNCKEDETKNLVESLITSTSADIKSYGSGSNGDIHAWTQKDFPEKKGFR